MSSKILVVLMAAASSLSVPVVAEANTSDSKVTICHRTNASPNSSGGQTIGGLQPGQVLEVSQSAVVKHHSQHQDVIVGAAARKAFSGKDCFTDVAGNLYNGAGQLVQSADGAGGGGPS